MPNADLNEETLKLLRADRRSINEIADGAKVNRHWLAKYRQGRFRNPGVRTVQALYEFLSPTPSDGCGSPRSFCNLLRRP